jgi:hypothetical protein
MLYACGSNAEGTLLLPHDRQNVPVPTCTGYKADYISVGMQEMMLRMHPEPWDWSGVWNDLTFWLIAGMSILAIMMITSTVLQLVDNAKS